MNSLFEEYPSKRDQNACGKLYGKYLIADVGSEFRTGMSEIQSSEPFLKQKRATICFIAAVIVILLGFFLAVVPPVIQVEAEAEKIFSGVVLWLCVVRGRDRMPGRSRCIFVLAQTQGGTEEHWYRDFGFCGSL